MKHVRSYDEINEGLIDDAWEWVKDKAHVLLPIAEIGSFFVPVIGPFLAMGFGLGDAALYAKEGDKAAAGITGALSILPGIGAIAKRIPGIKQLGKEGMEALGKKVAGKQTGTLSKVEKEVLQDIGKNSKLIKKNLIKEVEQKAAQKFNPKSCAISMVKESLVFEVLNESQCGGGMKMVQLATHDPRTILKLRELVFTTAKEKALNIHRVFRKIGKRTDGGIVLKQGGHKEIMKLNDDLLNHLREIKRGSLKRDVPFDDIPIGDMINQYGRRSQKLARDLEEGLIGKDEWAEKMFNMNEIMLDTIDKRLPTWNSLIKDGQRIKQSYSSTADKYGPYGGF